MFVDNILSSAIISILCDSLTLSAALQCQLVITEFVSFSQSLHRGK